MLRGVLLLLLLANGLYAAWTVGGLRNFGLVPYSPSEPQRLQQQLAPEALRILPAAEAAALEAAARSALCLQTPPPGAADAAVWKPCD